MTESVRIATRHDAPACAQLCTAAVDALQAARGGPLFLRREVGLVAKALLRPGGLDRLLADPRRRVVVGALDGVVLAVAVGRIDQVGEAAVGVVDALFVDPEARGIGVGRSLLDDLVAWFGRAGCRGVDASALPGDRAAKNFYEAAGFKGRLITMHRAID